MNYVLGMIFAALFVWWICWIIRKNRADEARIAEYERQSGHKWIREGCMRKGGLNPPPVPFVRPPPPKAWTARPIK